MAAMTPAETWTALRDGNHRFVNSAPLHPNQSSARRTAVANGQRPIAALFGCSDSRLAAEIIFDLGLGDLFVVRNMGQIISHSVVASLEYAAEILEVSLIIVLAHDSCGAVKAAIDQEGGFGAPLPPNIASAVGEIVPSARRARQDAGLVSGLPLDPDTVGRAHLKETISRLLTSSELVSQKIADGTLAVIGATYTLAEGAVSADVIVGDLSPTTEEGLH
jgi:carbonic anhydrase